MKTHVWLLCVLTSLLWIREGVCQADLPRSDSPFIYPEYSQRISMDFQNATLTDVLKIFSKQTNLNLITAENIATKRITMFLDDVPIEQALEQLLKANNLTYELQPGSNIYIVKPLAKPDMELVTRVYPLKHATVSRSKLRRTLDIRKNDGTTIDTQVSGSDDEGIKNSIETILTENGKIVEDPRTNSLIVTDIASNFANIERTIARLDVPIPQILIEVEMLEVTKGMTEKIGVRIGDTPLRFSGGVRRHVYPWDQNKLLNKGQEFGSTEFTTSRIDEQSQYILGEIDASGLTATLQFLKTQSGTKSLAKPSILTLNNEPAQIKIAAQSVIGSKSSTESSQNIATQTTEAERFETGVFLTVTPQANLKLDEITMAIVPKVVVTRSSNISTFLEPEERTAQSLLKVKSGDTIVIGGLMREEKQRTITKVPFLGDIPWLGQAFRHNNELAEDRELIIFITPHILTEENEELLQRQVTATNIVREQDFPSVRLENVDKALRRYELNK